MDYDGLIAYNLKLSFNNNVVGKEEIVRLPFLNSITWSGSTGLISA